jgi:hypothetical protein
MDRVLGRATLTQEVAHADITQVRHFGWPVFTDVISNGRFGEFTVIQIIQFQESSLRSSGVRFSGTTDMSTGLSAGSITLLPLTSAT